MWKTPEILSKIDEICVKEEIIPEDNDFLEHMTIHLALAIIQDVGEENAIIIANIIKAFYGK